MLKGTRIIQGSEALRYVETQNEIRKILATHGFEEVILPSIWGKSTFTEKLGAEKEGQMWTFKDKGGRECCLIPEVTGLIQELWNKNWSKEKPKPYKIFYVSRCYRYDRPQEGRYREFTQIGAEILGGKPPVDASELEEVMLECLNVFDIEYEIKSNVSRGLSYYVEDGFEAECLNLGAQKQVLGGGRYEEGIGWALGLDRCLLAEYIR